MIYKISNYNKFGRPTVLVFKHSRKNYFEGCYNFGEEINSMLLGLTLD